MGAAEALGGLRQNELSSAVWISEHFAVPKPNDPPPLRLQRMRSRRILVRTLDMLASIDLYPQLCLATGQVQDERRNG